jgi:hypothetical protein
MATIETLVTEGALTKIEVPLPAGALEIRLFYGTESFVNWLKTGLPNMQAPSDAQWDHAEQVDDLLLRYSIGEALSYGPQFHALHPGHRGVVELKTSDVRIFGWFYRRDVFIATNGHDTTFIKERGLYAGYRDEACRLRDQLNLDPPKFITGSMDNDFISTPP